MPVLIPVLDFISALQRSGATVESWDVLQRPRDYYRALDEDGRQLLLARWGVRPPENATVTFRTVRRRGVRAIPENLFVSVDVERDTDAEPWPRRVERAWTHALHAPFHAARPDGVDAPPGEDAAFGLPDVVFEPGARERTRRPVIDVLDAVWGGDAFDAERDEHFVPPPALADGETLVDSYWVEAPFARVDIVEHAGRNPEYRVREPKVTELERALMVTLNDRIRDALVTGAGDADDPVDAGPVDRAARVAGHVFEHLRAYRFRTDRPTAYKIAYYFVRNYLGFGRIEPVMRDPYVEDVSCNGPFLPLYVAHSRHETLRTNVTFDEMELNGFTVKLAQRGGKLLSVAQPVVDATLPDGSRVQACLGREVTSRGSAFTIRKFREDPLTIVDLIRSNTLSVDEAAFLWLAVELRLSFIVMGATASGKTTTMNCLSQFIPAARKIVTIEDTHEIKLEHENWLSGVTRDASGGDADSVIGMYDLLRAALRQRPDYLIVGEVRGEEGLTLFQAMSTGHTCFSTMHAGSVENAVYRLENAPINVPRVMLTSLDFFLLAGQVEVDGRHVRRLLNVTELDGLEPRTRNLRTNEVFAWNGDRDAHERIADSALLDAAARKAGWSRSRLMDALAARRRVLDDLVKANARSVKDVARAVDAFHARRAQDTGDGADANARVIRPA